MAAPGSRGRRRRSCGHRSACRCRRRCRWSRGTRTRPSGNRAWAARSRAGFARCRSRRTSEASSRSTGSRSARRLPCTCPRRCTRRGTSGSSATRPSCHTSASTRPSTASARGRIARCTLRACTRTDRTATAARRRSRRTSARLRRRTASRQACRRRGASRRRRSRRRPRASFVYVVVDAVAAVAEDHRAAGKPEQRQRKAREAPSSRLQRKLPRTPTSPSPAQGLTTRAPPSRGAPVRPPRGLALGKGEQERAAGAEAERGRPRS